MIWSQSRNGVEVCLCFEHVGELATIFSRLIFFTLRRFAGKAFVEGFDYKICG
jgi:hypothetical protein